MLEKGVRDDADDIHLIHKSNCLRWKKSYKLVHFMNYFFNVGDKEYFDIRYVQFL